MLEMNEFLSELKKNLPKELLYKFYPILVLEKLGFKIFKCKKCKINFLSFKKRKICGDADCGANASVIIRKKNISFVNFAKNFLNFFTKSSLNFKYSPKKFNNILYPFGTGLNFVVAGINAYTPGFFRETNQHNPNLESIFADLQFCVRFEDFNNTLKSNRHYLGFVMAGQHIIENKFTPFKSNFKGLVLEDLIKYLEVTLKIKLSKLTIHLDFWTDGENFGPCIEFFLNGVELANQVYMEYASKQNEIKDLPFRIVDMGLGLQRLYFTKTGKTVEENFNLKKENFDLLRTLSFFLNTDLSPSKTGLCYNYRRLLKIFIETYKHKDYNEDFLKIKSFLKFFDIDLKKILKRLTELIKYEKRNEYTDS